MTSESLSTVRVTRRFSVAPDRVFDAWLAPAKIAQWMLGPAPAEMVRTEVDARVGGAFTFVVRRQGEEIEHTGKYLEIARPQRLVFSFGVPRYSPNASIVSVDIRPIVSGCEVTLKADHVLPEYAERTQEGWRAILQSIAGIA